MPGARVELRKQQTASLKEVREDSAERDGRLLRRTMQQQDEQIAALRKQMEVILSREDDLKKMLFTATAERDELYRRNEEMYGRLYALYTKVAVLERNALNGGTAQAGDAQEKAARYQRLVVQIREVVRTTLPHASTVLVAAKGDDDLLSLYGRKG